MALYLYFQRIYTTGLKPQIKGSQLYSHLPYRNPTEREEVHIQCMNHGNRSLSYHANGMIAPYNCSQLVPTAGDLKQFKHSSTAQRSYIIMPYKPAKSFEDTLHIVFINLKLQL